MNKVKVFFGIAIFALAGTIAVQIPALAAKPVNTAQSKSVQVATTSTQGMMGGSGMQDTSKMHQGNGSNGCGNGNMQNMMSNPAMQKMMSNPAMQKMMQDPKMIDAMQKMMKDPETAKIMAQGAGMMNNPQMQKLMEKYLPKDLAKQCIKIMKDTNKGVKASATSV